MDDVERFRSLTTQSLIVYHRPVCHRPSSLVRHHPSSVVCHHPSSVIFHPLSLFITLCHPAGQRQGGVPSFDDDDFGDSGDRWRWPASPIPPNSLVADSLRRRRAFPRCGILQDPRMHRSTIRDLRPHGSTGGLIEERLMRKHMIRRDKEGIKASRTQN